MENLYKYSSWIIRIGVSLLFIISAIAKIYPDPSAYFSITTFEVKQISPLLKHFVPSGTEPFLAALLSRLLIGLEFTLGVLILLPFFLKKIVIPVTLGLLIFFCIQLGIDIYLVGNSGNCGCFGALLPMTPLEAIIKNVILIGFLFLLIAIMKKKYVEHNSSNSIYVIYGFFIALLFVFIPIKNTVNTKLIENTCIGELDPYGPEPTSSKFSKKLPFVDNGKVILCFFAPGCDHCMKTAKELAILKDELKNEFPCVHIVFMDEEADKIPEFFDFVGYEFNYQKMDLVLFWEVLGFENDTPGVYYLWNGNVLGDFQGINDNEFDVDKLKEMLTVK